MNKLQYKKFSIAAISLCFGALLPVLAQGDDIAYPANGQGNAPAGQTSPQSQQQGQVLRGGARGAAAGAAIGAIAGDAGKGAAIGATAGGLKKGFQKIDRKRNAQPY
jgi:hypothetical protein